MAIKRKPAKRAAKKKTSRPGSKWMTVPAGTKRVRVRSVGNSLVVEAKK